MTVALHACCGPCASACVPRLKAKGHAVTLLFANSNIDTAEEFERRRAAAEALARADGVPFAVVPYDHAEWLREVAAGFEDAPEKGARCARCYRYSLRKTAEFAAAHGLAAFTTSLTVSPHKLSVAVFAAGDEVCAAGRARRPRRADDGLDVPQFLHEDFKKRDGFRESVRRAAELGLYRQSYCGCEFGRRPPASTHRGNCKNRHEPYRAAASEMPPYHCTRVEAHLRCARGRFCNHLHIEAICDCASHN